MKPRARAAAPSADPFREHFGTSLRAEYDLLGARFRFEGRAAAAPLLALVHAAYRGLPSQRFTPGAAPLRVGLELLGPARYGRAPPQMRPFAAGTLAAAAMDGSTVIAVSPQQRCALVAASRDRLRHPYELRYEVIEFAVYLLAARAQGLAPLHAACLAREAAGVLLVGGSGAGKSTLLLQAAAQGLEVLAEDSVLVRPTDLVATGTANFLHLREDSLRFIDAPALRAYVRHSPQILRRSGVRKFEVDLRGAGFRLARRAPALHAVVFLRGGRPRAATRLEPLPVAALRRQLTAEQPYAAHQPGWQRLLAQVSRVPAFVLRRAAHPRAALEALTPLLSGAAAPRRRWTRA